MRTQQVNDNELFRRRVGQHLLKRRQHVGIVFAGALGALLVHIELLVGLFREHRQHGVARRHRLLVGYPEGFITRLLHQVHQRGFGQIQVRVLLIREGQRLLQNLNCVGTRCDHIVEHGKVGIGLT